MSNTTVINQAFNKELVSFPTLFQLFHDDLKKRIDKNYNFSLHARPLSPAEFNKYPSYQHVTIRSTKEFEHFTTTITRLDTTEFMVVSFKKYNDLMLIFKVCECDTPHVIVRTCKSITSRWERIGGRLYFVI